MQELQPDLLDSASDPYPDPDTFSAFDGLTCKHAASASVEVVVPAKICIMRAGTVRDAAGLILRSCCRAFGGFGFLLLE
jgi:hypothetical protein